ncbi:MAG: hypothetical protein IPN38_19945 [Flavobacteriales bacterium]|nr:hypothetical protein [Flavobacteriales bacterium]
MRFLLLLLFLWHSTSLSAQPELEGELNTLPTWMQHLISTEKPQPYILPKRVPLHTNAFIGTWSVQKQGGYRYDFWSDKQRVVIQEFDLKGERRKIIYIDLASNVRMTAGTDEERNAFLVEDLYIPQAGYFHELWNDSVRATGRVETMLGTSCRELLGIDGNKDTTYYWSTDLHPDLFADVLEWGEWLCREGELEYLTALSDRNAGGSLRVDWPKRRFGSGAGSIAFLSITPGATPMPVLEHKPYKLFERRFQWMNNSGIGRLPGWMRAYLTTLPPHPLPAEYTPEPVDRDLPDNAFIGTLTAETPTMILGLPDKTTGRDTTHRLARYSYWADARRAVLQLDDPDDEGYILYAVDLDADVAMAAVNEGHSYVIPKLYIGGLEEVGLSEFGRGLELSFSPTGKYQTMLGRTCELNTTYERYLSRFWFPKEKVLNPVFDMKNWMVQRMGQKFKDLMVFGVADKPMPMAVMGTHLTSYRPGKVKPPVLDLSNYSVRDQRLNKRRERASEAEIAVREYSGGSGQGMGDVTQDIGYDVAVPNEVVMEDLSESVVAVQDEPPPPPTAAAPFLENYLNTSVNRFTGSATLLFKWVQDNKTITWTVRYWSTRERSVLISTSNEALPSIRTRAWIIDRKAGTETEYEFNKDSIVTPYSQALRTSFLSTAPPFLLDTAIGPRQTVLDRSCIYRRHQGTLYRRDAWCDAETPSLYMDLYAARKGWEGMDHILFGQQLGTCAYTQPLKVDYVGPKDQISMRVVSISREPVDPNVFKITKASFTP